MIIPIATRRISVNKLSSDFRAATSIIEEPVAAPVAEMIIKNLSVGIDTSDVNFLSGAYLPGVKPSFNCGFEAVGTIVAAGPKAMLKEGDHCVTLIMVLSESNTQLQERLQYFVEFAFHEEIFCLT